MVSVRAERQRGARENTTLAEVWKLQKVADLVTGSLGYDFCDLVVPKMWTREIDGDRTSLAVNVHNEATTEDLMDMNTCRVRVPGAEQEVPIPLKSDPSGPVKKKKRIHFFKLSDRERTWQTFVQGQNAGLWRCSSEICRGLSERP